MSHVEFDFVWELLDAGERPYPITVASFGATMEERAALRDQVLRELADRGWHDGVDLHPRFEQLLSLLVRNTFTIDGQIAVEQRHLRVLAAGRGDRGSLCVQTDDEVRLEEVRGTNVVGSVVALLPEEKPGPGSPVTLPSTLFSEAAQSFASGGYLGFERTLNGGGVAGRDLRVLSTLVESGRHGGGQLAANSVDRVGRRTRSPVVNWFDTDAGRYVVNTERRRGGEEWLTFAPGDTNRVAQRLSELVAKVTQ
jgi:hypothetical protein